MHAEHATRLIASLAGRRRGLVRRHELLAAGIGRGAIDHRAGSGSLIELHPGVYAVGHTALTQHARWLAATWAFGRDDVVLSDRSAAELWRILPATRELHVTVPTTHGLPERPGVTPHRRPVPDRHRRTVDGIRTVSLERVLLDLAETAGAEVVAEAFEEAQVRHRLTPVDLEIEAVARRGHRGTAVLRALLADAVDPGLVESRLELRFLRFCRDHGLPRPDTQIRIGPWRVDFLFSIEGVVVETDGARFHATAARRRRDAQKTEDLERRGYVVVRLRWADVVDTPAPTAARLAAVLAARRVARSA